LSFLFGFISLDVVVQFLIKEAFSKPSLHNTSSSTGIGRRCEGIEPLESLKRGVGGSRIYYSIISKLNMR